MHKAIFVEGQLKYTITPDGPILVKAGETGGADPTRPDMEFVRTRHRQSSDTAETSREKRTNDEDKIYIPGPSLKGVVRAQCERICRSLDKDGRNPDQDDPPLADNPLGEGTKYGGLEDMNYSSGRYIEAIRKQIENNPERTAIIYRRSSLVSQMFGHTSLAGRVRFADAYGKNVITEERNGVAIDRIYGSVAVGPFNYETVVAGTFETSIDVKNITLAQLALLGLALRDIAEGRVAIGFGKSRGLGRVKVTFNSLTLRYPTCEVRNGNLQLLNGRVISEATYLAGLGAFIPHSAYALSADDLVALPAGMNYAEDADHGIGVFVHASNEQAVRNLWKACMPAWKQTIGWQL